ncbi:MAG: SAM hydrolase/SAM-dependent halogenase family protein [Rhodothermales bacterium]
MFATNGILTLTTDFGSQDGYVAAMKGVMLGINPDLKLVDVSHDIAPHDIMDGAFVLRTVAEAFPNGTVHLAVVDPGVGSSRKAIAMKYRNQLFVGPDNGLFSLLLAGQSAEKVVELDQPRFWRDATISTTFHGRDIFAPIAARLASGLSLSSAGTPITSIKSLHWALPISDDQGIQGWVVHIDRFGNCITNIARDQFESHRRSRTFKCYAGTSIIASNSETYSDVDPGEPTVLFNSQDMLEIAIHKGSASSMLNIRKGAPVNILFMDDKT